MTDNTTDRRRDALALALVVVALLVLAGAGVAAFDYLVAAFYHVFNSTR